MMMMMIILILILLLLIIIIMPTQQQRDVKPEAVKAFLADILTLYRTCAVLKTKLKVCSVTIRRVQ